MKYKRGLTSRFLPCQWLQVISLAYMVGELGDSSGSIVPVGMKSM